MTTFTASEVRDTVSRMAGGGSAIHMLHAFADRLEADEKAVPVTWVNSDDLHNPNFVGINAVKVGHEGLGKHYTLPLYTHPAPDDAERLSEALHSLGERLSSILCDPFGDVVVRGSDGDRQVIAKALKDLGELAAHSTQAQPPAASAPNLERYVVIDRAALNRMLTTRDFSELMLAAQEHLPTDQFDPEHNVRPGDIGTEAQLQAARVQDAKGCVWSEDEDGNWDTGCGNMFVITEGTPYDNEMGFCCYCGHKLDQVTQPTAAQESPNG